jgi:hypothetical protein
MKLVLATGVVLHISALSNGFYKMKEQTEATQMEWGSQYRQYVKVL